MTGMHAMHMIVGAGLLTTLIVMAARNRFSAAWYTPVEMIGLYWHFVDIVWIFLFPLLVFDRTHNMNHQVVSVKVYAAVFWRAPRAHDHDRGRLQARTGRVQLHRGNDHRCHQGNAGGHVLYGRQARQLHDQTVRGRRFVLDGDPPRLRAERLLKPWLAPRSSLVVNGGSIPAHTGSRGCPESLPGAGFVLVAGEIFRSNIIVIDFGPTDYGVEALHHLRRSSNVLQAGTQNATRDCLCR